jgi:chondroitin 4-sulfotransferase 11
VTQSVASVFKTLWRRVTPRPAKDDSPLRTGPNGTFVFIHINKNAGTSIGQAIGLPKKQHLTVKEVIEIVGRPAWDGAAFRFSIVRNPWDKVVSHYNHRIKTNQTGLKDNPIPFKEWVAATYGPVKDARYYDQPKMFQPQVEWLRDSKGRIELDLIGRFEDLGGTYRQIADRLGVKAELPHLNKSERSDYRASYDDETAAVVGQWFAEDVSRFGYTFDPRPAP